MEASVASVPARVARLDGAKVGPYISEYILSYSPSHVAASRTTGKLGRLEGRARLEDLARLHNFAIARLHAVPEEWRQHDSDQEARSL